MKASIPRTATLAWSPRSLDSVAKPYIATGTVAGALDDSFSNESVLEVWQPGYSGEDEKLSPIASVSTGAR
jgi:protein transport protein SEC31